MANPPLEMRPTREWSSTEWEIGSQIVYRAAHKAEKGLGFLGVQYVEPKRGYAEVLRSNGVSYSAGRAYNSQEFTLYTLPINVSKPRINQRSAEWSCTVLHEATHCTRMEEFNDESIIEHVASEGLACIAEEMYRKKFCGKQVVSDFLAIDLVPDDRLAAQFGEHKDKDCSDAAAMKWFNTKKYDELRLGALYGAQRVMAQVQLGNSIPDLMRQPAGDVLGL